MASEIIKLNGTEFNTRFDGPATAPVVILSNSLATNLSLWDGFVSTLSNRYRIFRYDQRGHGGSAASPPPYSMPMLVEDLINLLDRLDIRRAHFIGISMGGITGHGLAQVDPERLLSLTVCDATPKSGSPADWERRLEIVREHGIEAIVEPTLQRWFTAESMEADTPAVRRVREMIRTTSLDGFVGCVNALQAFDYSAGLESIRIPVLFVAGASDGARPKTIVEDAARIEGARFEIIPDAGHLCNIENEAAFNATVGGFIDQIGS